MSNPSTLGPWLRRFLAEYIVTERNLARNTQKSYRDTFALLLPFVRARTASRVGGSRCTNLTARHVLQFLDHLESDRACSVQTRNQRLSAIRSFARFVASRDPVHIEWSASIRSIASKKATPQPIGWLSKTQLNDLLEAPDRRTPRGRIEHALLLFLYNTGARVSEATSSWPETCRPDSTTADTRSSTSMARAENNDSVRCGREPNPCSTTSCRDGKPAMPYSSAGSKGPTRGSGSTGSSSAVRPAPRRSPEEGSRHTRSATRVPATCSRPEST